MKKLEYEPDYISGNVGNKIYEDCIGCGRENVKTWWRNMPLCPTCAKNKTLDELPKTLEEYLEFCKSNKKVFER